MASSPPPPPPHVVVLPFAQQGHINPLVQLAKKLAAHGFTITFVLSENTVPENPNPSPNLTFAGVPDLLPPERSRGSVFRDSVDSMTNMEPGFRDFIHRLHHSDHPVTAIITDVFMIWCYGIAAELSIPCLTFFTSNATAASVFDHVPSLVDMGVLPFPRDEKDNLISKEEVRDIPGVLDLLPEEFPLCITFDETHFRYRFITSMAYLIRDAPAIIINSVEELEKDAAAALRGSKKKVFTVGPLLLMSETPTLRLDVNYWAEEDHCIEWLERQALRSVLYVSFGSVASLSPENFREFAMGLEASNAAFLWVVRRDSIDAPLEEALPDGFLGRTKGRGLIISWGPQLMILSHPAIAAFLTHCGWNSIIENMSTGFVPMICWPQVAEQRLNRRLITESWKIGLGFERNEDGSGVGRDEIARVVKEVMEGERSHELRSVTTTFRDLVRGSVRKGGSSYASFEELLDYILHLNE